MDENQTPGAEQDGTEQSGANLTGADSTDSGEATEIDNLPEAADDEDLTDSADDELEDIADLEADGGLDFENDPSLNPAFNPAFNNNPPPRSPQNMPGEPYGYIPQQAHGYPQQPSGYISQQPHDAIPHNTHGYTPPLGYIPRQPSGYTPPPGHYPQMPHTPNMPNMQAIPPMAGIPGTPGFYEAKANRRFPKGAFVAVSIIIVLVAVIIAILAYMSNLDSNDLSVPGKTPGLADRDYTPNNNGKNNVNITVEQVDRPLLADENYINRDTGLMTAEGVGEYVMPSVALINVYGGNYFSPIAYGSGVILSANGYIITNAHVVDGGTEYSVTLSDGKVYEAALVGMSTNEDVAVLKISAEGLTPATFGKSADVRLGEEVVIVASSGETFDNFCTFGHVSNTERIMATDMSSGLTCFQTDAAVNAGTSGGPVVNMYGQCIGIVVGKYIDLQSGMYENMGFVIQVDTVLETAESLIANGYAEGEVILGILYISLDNLTALSYDVPSGLLVSDVTEDGGALAAGIIPNDIVTEINGQPVLTPESITKALEGKRAGDTVDVTVARKRITGEVEMLTLQVVLKQKVDLPDNDSFYEMFETE